MDDLDIDQTGQLDQLDLDLLAWVQADALDGWGDARPVPVSAAA
jgi:hypothetical protein